MGSNVSNVDLPSRALIFLTGIYHAILDALLESHKAVSSGRLQKSTIRWQQMHFG